jgi:hypothetical protein
MAGLVPAIHVFNRQVKTWMPGTIGSEATPFFEHAMAGLTRRES